MTFVKLAILLFIIWRFFAWRQRAKKLAPELQRQLAEARARAAANTIPEGDESEGESEADDAEDESEEDESGSEEGSDDEPQEESPPSAARLALDSPVPALHQHHRAPPGTPLLRPLAPLPPLAPLAPMAPMKALHPRPPISAREPLPPLAPRTMRR